VAGVFTLARRCRPAAAWATALALAASLTACTGTSEPDAEPSGSPSPSASSSASAGPVTLRFGVSGDRDLRTALRELATDYTEANPGVTVEVEQLDPEVPLTEQLTGADRPDVFVAGAADAPGLVAAEMVQPVDQLLEERGVLFGDGFQRLGLEAFSAEQALQCMPFDVSPLVVFYNRGLVPFRRLVEPDDEPLSIETGWTWEQFAEAARLMSQDEVKGMYVEPEMLTVMALVRSAGADVVDDPRDASTLTFSEDGTRAALEEILAVVRDPDLTPNERQLARMDGVTRFARERVGMIIGTRELVPQLRQFEELDFDVFPMPRLARERTVAKVSGFCMSADTAQPDAAADFLTYATGEAGAETLAETGAVVPAYLPALKSEAFTQPDQRPESAVVFDEALARSSTIPFEAGWTELVQQVDPELDRMFFDPVIDLDTLLPQIDLESEAYLAPEEAPPPSP
jgi:multiple sugar transport system substrate-binding protein